MALVASPASTSKSSLAGGSASVASRASTCAAALETHVSLNKLTDQSFHNFGDALAHARHQLPRNVRCALRTLQRLANDAKHVWPATPALDTGDLTDAESEYLPSLAQATLDNDNASQSTATSTYPASCATTPPATTSFGAVTKDWETPHAAITVRASAAAATAASATLPLAAKSSPATGAAAAAPASSASRKTSLATASLCQATTALASSACAIEVPRATALAQQSRLCAFAVVAFLPRSATRPLPHRTELVICVRAIAMADRLSNATSVCSGYVTDATRGFRRKSGQPGCPFPSVYFLCFCFCSGPGHVSFGCTAKKEGSTRKFD